MSGRIALENMGDGVLDDEALSALPSWLAASAGAKWSMIQWRHLDGVHEVMAASARAPGGVALYARRYAATDPWLKAALASAVRDEVVALGSLAPANPFEKSRLYQKVIRPSGVDATCAAVGVFSNAWGDAIVSLHWGSRQEPFASVDLCPVNKRLSLMAERLGERGALIGRLRWEQVRSDDLDGLKLGSILLRDDARLVRINLGADRVLRRADGLHAANGRLSCVEAGSRFRLQAALALATAPDNAIATAIPVERVPVAPEPPRKRGAPLPYMVSVTPARGENGERLAMLVFRDPDGREESLMSRLHALFVSRDEPLNSRRQSSISRAASSGPKWAS